MPDQRRQKNAWVIERQIRSAEAAIRSHGFTLVYQDYCEDAETPGILGYYAGMTSHAKKRVKIATRRRTRKQILETLRHELHHVEDPLWDCGNRDVFGRPGEAAERRRAAGL